MLRLPYMRRHRQYTWDLETVGAVLAMDIGAHITRTTAIIMGGVVIEEGTGGAVTVTAGTDRLGNYTGNLRADAKQRRFVSRSVSSGVLCSIRSQKLPSAYVFLKSRLVRITDFAKAPQIHVVLQVGELDLAAQWIAG